MEFADADKNPRVRGVELKRQPLRIRLQMNTTRHCAGVPKRRGASKTAPVEAVRGGCGKK